jgi:hypothetical protein
LPSFTRIQGVGFESTSLVTTGSVTLSVTAGNLLIVNACCTSPSGGSITSVGDTVNTYTQDVSNENTYFSSDEVTNIILSTIAVSSISITVTIGTNRSALITFSVQEFSMSGGTLAIDNMASGFDPVGSTTPSTPTLGSLFGDDLIIVGFDINTPSLTYTIPSPFTLDYSVNSPSSEPFVSQYDINETSPTVTPSCTLSGSSPWNSVAIAYKLVTATTSIFDSDLSTAIDQQILISSSLQSEVAEFATASEQQLLFTSVYQVESPQVFDNDNVLVFILFYDIATGLDAEQEHNVLMGYDSDSAFASETQFLIGQFFYGIESPLASESMLREFLSTESPLAIDIQVFSTHIFISVDQCIASEDQLTIITGGSSATVYDSQPTAGSESWLRIIRQADHSTAIERQYNAVSVLGAGIDHANGFESQLPIRLDGELPISTDAYYFLSRIYSTESPLSVDRWILSPLIIQTEGPRAIDKQIVLSSFIFTSPANADSAFGREAALPIRFSSESPLELEIQFTIITGGSSATVYDKIPTAGLESSLRTIFSSEKPTATDKGFVFISIITIGSGVTDSAIGRESQLPIRLGYESPSELESQLRIIIDINPSYAKESQHLLISIITTGHGVTESAIAHESQIRFFLSGDFGHGFDTNQTVTSSIPTYNQCNTITDLLISIYNYLMSTGIVGPQSVDYVIDPDSTILYPTLNGPLLLIQPLTLSNVGDDTGGGRFSKLLEFQFYIHVITDNIYDISFKDTTLSTSGDPITGPYEVAASVQQAMEQAYLTYLGNPTAVEFPFFEETGVPRRYKGANSYSGLPTKFRVLFRENLPTLEIISPLSITGDSSWTIFLKEPGSDFTPGMPGYPIFTCSSGTIDSQLIPTIASPYKQENVILEYTPSISSGYVVFSDSSNCAIAVIQVISPPLDPVGGIQWTTYIDFFKSLVTLINSFQILGIYSVDIVVPQDSVYKWPINPSPFILIEPNVFKFQTEGIGGGRYSHTFDMDFKVHLVVNNIYDMSFRDTNLLTTNNPTVSTYSFVDHIIGILEQSYPVDPTGMITAVEFPRMTSVDAPVRYSNSNNLSDIVTNFYVKICLNMSNTNENDAMPN